jgi:hypothetical protein
MNIRKMIVMPLYNQLADINSIKPIIVTLDNELGYIGILSFTCYNVVVTTYSCLYDLLIDLVKY